MSLNYNQSSEQEFNFLLLSLVIVVGASFLISPMIMFEFTNGEENPSNNEPVFEEIEGDILDSTHPYIVEQLSKDWKKLIWKSGGIAIQTKAGMDQIVNLPEAGGPKSHENPNNKDPNDVPSEKFNSNYGLSSQESILQTSPSFDIPVEELDSVPDNVPSVITDFDQYIVGDCTQRGPESDLHNCNFHNSNLYGTVLTVGNLRNADFSKADLMSAYLRGADLSYADLSGTNLRGAYLKGANLEGANLMGADLNGVNLLKANLEGANFSGAILSHHYCGWEKPINPDLNGDKINDVELVEEQFYGWCTIKAK